jgi:hypothetical protein
MDSPRPGGLPMFEDEIALEKKTSSIGPLLMISALVLIVGGGLVWFFVQSRKQMSPAEAESVISTILKTQGPAVVQFHAGLVNASVNDKPYDPHYTLLEKSGVIKTAKAVGGAKSVTLTADGEKQVSAFPEFKTSKEQDGTTLYVVPLAQRKLVSVGSVKMNGPNQAIVQYTWKWEPNALGQSFDASGPLVKSFNTWDRSTLIQKYGADFYNAAPASITVKLVNTSKGWKLAQEE